MAVPVSQKNRTVGVGATGNGIHHKLKPKSSKPIINWLQRKMGTRARHVDEGKEDRRLQKDNDNATNAGTDVRFGQVTEGKSSTMRAMSKENGRTTSIKEFHTAPLRMQNGANRTTGVADEVGFNANYYRTGGTVSLNDERSRSRSRSLSHEHQANDLTANVNSIIDNRDSIDGYGYDDASTHQSSMAAFSMWSPSNPLEADEDASTRPIPPTSPPSPSPSRDSSSYLSASRTFQSVAPSASTKPTTLLSIDLTQPTGMMTHAHIAQVPPTPTSPSTPPSGNNQTLSPSAARYASHIRTSSNFSITGSNSPITFSALPATSPQSSSRPSSLNPVRSGSTATAASNVPIMLQAPQHTTHHPRNNPRPSSPPLDNASVLTLASSAFAFPVNRHGGAGGAGSGSTSTFGWMVSGADRSSISGTGTGTGVPSTIIGGDRTESVNNLDCDADDSTSQIALDDGLLGDGDGYDNVDASVRALRPRSSRRGSWSSEASGWSAKLSGNGSVSVAGTGVSGTEYVMAREKSMKSSIMALAPSVRTDGPELTIDDGDSVTDDYSHYQVRRPTYESHEIISAPSSPLAEICISAADLEDANKTFVHSVLTAEPESEDASNEGSSREFDNLEVPSTMQSTLILEKPQVEEPSRQPTTNGFAIPDNDATPEAEVDADAKTEGGNSDVSLTSSNASQPKSPEMTTQVEVDEKIQGKSLLSLSPLVEVTFDTEKEEALHSASPPSTP